MIVSHEHQFVFVKTRKTAGTSMEIALSEHCGDDDIITPISPEDEAHRRSLGFRGAQNYSFPVKRYTTHQATKALRQGRPYRYINHTPADQIRRGIGNERWRNYFCFTIERNPFDKAVSRYYWERFRGRSGSNGSIDQFVITAGTGRLSDWPLYANADEISVDFILRYESLSTDIVALSEQLDIDIRLPAVRAKGDVRPDSQPYTELLGSIARRKIETCCWREMAALGYTW